MNSDDTLLPGAVSVAVGHLLQTPEVDLKSAFLRATEENVPPDELLATVRRLVRDLKRQGRPPEQVIVAVKQVCGLPLITFAADTDAAADGSHSKQISDMMLRAAIDEYYMKPRSKSAAAESKGKKLEK